MIPEVKKTGSSSVSMGSQLLTYASDALVLPTLVNPCGTLETGVYAAGKIFVEPSLLSRSNTRLSVSGKFTQAKHTRDYTAIYAGPLLNHYGHFILEALGRLAVVRSFPELPIVWSCRVLKELNNQQLQRRARCLEFQKAILKYLNITNPVEFIVEPTCYRELIIPEPGYRISDTYTRWHDDFLSTQQYSPSSGRKIWLSRTKLKRITDIGELNSVVLEQRLEQQGWEVFHPQEHDFETQIRTLASAERIAGFEGSALHNVMFLSQCSELKVDIVSRRGRINPNYLNIAQTKGFVQTIHHDPDRIIVESKGAHVLSCSPKPAIVIEKLDNTVSPEPELLTEAERQLQGSVSSLIEENLSKDILLLGSQYLRLKKPSDKAAACRSVTVVNERFRYNYHHDLNSDFFNYFEVPVESYFNIFTNTGTTHDCIIVAGDSAARIFQNFTLAWHANNTEASWLLCLDNGLPKPCEGETQHQRSNFIAGESALLCQLLLTSCSGIQLRPVCTADSFAIISIEDLKIKAPVGSKVSSSIDPAVCKQAAVNSFCTIPERFYLTTNELISEHSTKTAVDSAARVRL